jgi:RNA polymerase sigma factor (sigma-70 family)
MPAALDDAAFDDCYRSVRPLVMAKCRRMVRGDADAADLTQEVFARLWKHRDLLQDRRGLTAWIYRTATRLVIDRARRQAAGRQGLLQLRLLGPDEADGGPDDRLSSRRQLRGVIAGVPSRELEAAILEPPRPPGPPGDRRGDGHRRADRPAAAHPFRSACRTNQGERVT